MKKIGLILFLVLWIPFIALAKPTEEDPQGLGRYIWDTPLNVIYDAENLQYIHSMVGVNIYRKSEDIMHKGQLIANTGYIFKDDHLVACYYVFFNKEAYDYYLNYMEIMMGKPDGFNSSLQAHFYEFPNTFIFLYRAREINDSDIILFTKKEYFEENQ